MTTSESFVKFEKVDKSYDGEVLVVKDLNVDIFTIDGRRLTDKMEIHKTMNGFSIDRGQLASGNYLIRLSHISGLNVFQRKLSVL